MMFAIFIFRGVKFLAIFFFFFGIFVNSAYSAETYSDSNPDFVPSYLEPACSLFGIPDENGKILKLSSKYVRPMSSRIIECIDGTLSNLFIKPDAKTQFTLFQVFQSVVKPMVILVLILYVAFNGYLIATGQLLKQNPKQEILMFILKFIFVFYFAIGDAWKDFFFVALRSISSTLGGIMIEAGVNTVSDGCIFTGYGATPYPVGKEYIAIFDTLDCKFGNYIGWFTGRKFPILVPIAFVMFFLGFVGSILFSISLTLVFQIVTLAFRICNLYLLSIIMLTILIYASPIIVPMALFPQTKNMFDRWLGKIMSNAIYPLVLFSFVGVLLAVMDRIYYGPKPDENELFNPSKPFSSTNSDITVNLTTFAKVMENKIREKNPSWSNIQVMSEVQKEIKRLQTQLAIPQLESSIYIDVNGNEIIQYTLKPGESDRIISATVSDSAFNNLLRNPNAVDGADPNPKCYGGIARILSSVATDIALPIVCLMAMLEDSYSVYGLPIPGFLEIIQLYIPSHNAVAALFIFFVAALLCCVLNFVLGVIFEQMESVIDNIAGTSFKSMVQAPTMTEATKAGMNSQKQMREAQQKTFRREQGNKDSGAKEGGEQNINAKGKEDGGNKDGEQNINAKGKEDGAGGGAGGGAGIGDAGAAAGGG